MGKAEVLGMVLSAIDIKFSVNEVIGSGSLANISSVKFSWQSVLNCSQSAFLKFQLGVRYSIEESSYCITIGKWSLPHKSS